MGWADLLTQTETVTLPWVGGRTLAWKARWLKIKGKAPRTHGWHKFEVGGGKEAKWVGEGEVDFSFEEGRKILRGYLVGDWLIPDGVHAIHDYDTMPDQAVRVHLLDDGLERFSRVAAVKSDTGFYVFLRPEFPMGPEEGVLMAYQDNRPTVSHVRDVTPALELSFHWEVWHRDEAEKRRAELERVRREEDAHLEKEERIRQVRERVGDGKGRRELAKVDFKAAAEAALAISGARLLDQRRSTMREEMVVDYEFQGRRLQCVCDMDLNIVNAGICLTDHRTGVKGDTRFTLESLPAIVAQAMRLGKLVVWRHAGGQDNDYEDDSEDY